MTNTEQQALLDRQLAAARTRSGPLTNRQAERIIAEAVEAHNVDPAVITGRRRDQAACAARWAVWAKFNAMGCSLTESGEATGHHHTTVLHGLRRLAA